jgi:hypothetical protein
MSRDALLQEMQQNEGSSQSSAKPAMTIVAGADDLISPTEFWKKVAECPEGSLLHVVKQGDKKMKSWMQSSAFNELTSLVMADDVDFTTFVLFRIFSTHSIAVSQAQQAYAIQGANGKKATSAEIIAKVTGMDIKKNSDLEKVAKKILAMHPSLFNLLRNKAVKSISRKAAKAVFSSGSSRF